jgi:hypothetical protein
MKKERKRGGRKKYTPSLPPTHQHLTVYTQVGHGHRYRVSLIRDTDQDCGTLFAVKTLDFPDTKYTVTNTRLHYMYYTFMTDIFWRD